MITINLLCFVDWIPEDHQGSPRIPEDHQCLGDPALLSPWPSPQPEVRPLHDQLWLILILEPDHLCHHHLALDWIPKDLLGFPRITKDSQGSPRIPEELLRLGLMTWFHGLPGIPKDSQGIPRIPKDHHQSC